MEINEQFRESLIERLQYMRAYHDVWASLLGRGLRPNYVDEMNEHFVLVKVIENSAFTSFLIRLGTLFDRDPRSITLHRLVEKLRSEGEVSDSLESRYSDLVERAGKLNIIRNKIIAHSCESNLVRDYFEEAEITYRELTEVMTDTWQLADELFALDDNQELVYGFSPIPDLKKLFPKYDDSSVWL